MTHPSPLAEPKVSVRPKGHWRGRMFSWSKIVLSDGATTEYHEGEWLTHTRWATRERAEQKILEWFATKRRATKVTWLLDIVFFPEERSDA